MEALLLKSEGLPHADITRIVGICENTLRSYLKDYQEQGIEKLKEINFYRPSSELEAYRGTLEDYFREHPVATFIVVNGLNGVGIKAKTANTSTVLSTSF
jgi:hypothetical protein